MTTASLPAAWVRRQRRAGLANYLDVLDAEAPLFGLERAETDLRARALQAEVSLYRALGGGYEDGVKTPR